MYVDKDVFGYLVTPENPEENISFEIIDNTESDVPIIVIKTNDTENTIHISILRYKNGEVIVTKWESESLHVSYQIKDNLLIQTRAHMGGWEYNVHKINLFLYDFIKILWESSHKPCKVLLDQKEG